MNFLIPTSGGIPINGSQPDSYNMSTKFYVSSLISHVLFLVLFVFGLGFSIYRTAKKLKNPKFTNDDEEQEQEEEKAEGEEGAEKKETNDNLIYKFDEDEAENEKNDDEEKEKDPDQKEGEGEKKEEDDEEVRIISQRLFLIQDKVMNFMPWVIGALLSINALKADFIVVTCLALSMIVYLLFNVFEYAKKHKFAQLAFMIPAYGMFLPFFINNIDLS